MTTKVKTQKVKDLSYMTGKIKEFKELIEAEVVSLAGSFDTDNVVSLYNEVTYLYKQEIEVDSENISSEDIFIIEENSKEKEMFGFFEVNNFPVFGFNLGGDWETPVYGVFVSDGKQIYSYIPLCGNSYNPKYFSAYGNNDDSVDGDKARCNFDLIKEDIAFAFDIKAEIPEEVNELKDSLDELVEAVEALTDDETGAFLRNGLEEIFEKIQEVITNATSSCKTAETELASAKKEVSDLETEIIGLNKKIVELIFNLCYFW